MKNFKSILTAITVLLLLSACENKKSEKTNGMTTQPQQEVDMHNTENSIDWEGYYFGVLPCASCPGIRTSITLFENGRYERTIEYMGQQDHEKADEEKGKIKWSNDKTKITIGENQYLVGEETLTLLDAEGKMITGELAKNYVLTKSEYEEVPTVNEGIYLEQYLGDDGITYNIVFDTKAKVQTALVESKSGNLKIQLPQTKAWSKGAEYMKDTTKLIAKGDKATLYVGKKTIKLTRQQ